MGLHLICTPCILQEGRARGSLERSVLGLGLPASYGARVKEGSSRALHQSGSLTPLKKKDYSKPVYAEQATSPSLSTSEKRSSIT